MLINIKIIYYQNVILAWNILCPYRKEVLKVGLISVFKVSKHPVAKHLEKSAYKKKKFILAND